MKKEIALRMINVSLKYEGGSKKQSLKNYLINLKHRKYNSVNNSYQISDLNFTIYRGEKIGVVGRNGSGKSTLLKLIAGVLIPDKGVIEISGTASPVLDLTPVMHLELTCLDNIFLYGAFMGFRRDQVKQHLSEIVECAQIDDYLDTQFGSISTGMKSRLAFAVASALKPNIMLLDEVLSVGDLRFQKMARMKMIELSNTGTASLIVSHDLHFLENICDRIIWIENGNVQINSDPRKIIKAYKALLG